MSDTRYPYTYACDLIRPLGGYGPEGIKLDRSSASQILRLFSTVLGLPNEDVARKLADHYLANEEQLAEENARRCFAAFYGEQP